MRKYFSMFFYELRFALMSIKHNLLMSVSAMSAVAISLILVAVFAVGGFHILSFSQNAKDEMAIHVIYDDALSLDQEKAIQKQIDKLENVSKTEFSNKDNELDMMIQEKGSSFGIYKGADNPLNDALFVYVKNPDLIKETAAEIENISGIYSSAYGGSSVARFLSLLKTVQIGGAVVILLLMLLCLYLIYSTIKAAVESRKDEIAIMRQVGATNTFIYVPFEMEGIIIGLLGAALPFILSAFIYPSIYNNLNGKLFANVFPLMPVSNMLLIMGFLLFGSGIILGAFAAFLAVRKYLNQTR